MTEFITRFLAKKQPIQQDDTQLQAQAALQQRLSRMMQHQIAVTDHSASS